MANNCPKKKKGRKKFQGKCRGCRKQVHKEVDCWENPNNAGKKPKWYKCQEKSLATQNQEQNSGTKYLLVTHNLGVCGVCDDSLEEDYTVVKEDNSTIKSMPSLIEPKDYWSSDEKSERKNKTYQEEGQGFESKMKAAQREVKQAGSKKYLS
eukprot:9327004-Ditylum_brightwellii.AAC.1